MVINFALAFGLEEGETVVAGEFPDFLPQGIIHARPGAAQYVKLAWLQTFHIDLQQLKSSWS